MTRKILTAAVLVVMMANAAAAFSLDFTIYNQSGSTFKEIMLSPSWYPNIDRNRDLVTRRGSRKPLIILHGHHEEIMIDHLTDERRGCRYWDLYVKCANGREGFWRGIDLSTTVAVRIDRRLSLEPFTATDILNMF